LRVPRAQVGAATSEAATFVSLRQCRSLITPFVVDAV
jgi:hypothetical protein